MSRTVVYDRWYLAERKGAGNPPPPRTRLPRYANGADPREALAAVVDRHSTSLAALSVMLGRGRDYLRRFIADGVPAALRPEDHATLARFYGVETDALGIRDMWRR